MFLHFSPPVRPIKTKKIETTNESEEVSVLSLAPFTSNPKLYFENIPLGQRASRKLVIKNPTGLPIELSIKHSVPEELNFQLSWESAKVTESEVELDLFWQPNSSGSWRFILTFSNGKRIHRDVPVVFKAVSPAKKKKTISMKTKRPSYLAKKSPSPVKKYKTPKRSERRPLPVVTNIPELYDKSENPKISISYTNENKENFNRPFSIPLDSSVDSFKSINNLLNLKPNSTQERRDTYIIAGGVNSQLHPLLTLKESNDEERRNTYVVDPKSSSVNDLPQTMNANNTSDVNLSDSLEMDSVTSPTNRRNEVPNNVREERLPQTDIVAHLQSSMFTFTPVTTPKMIYHFEPSNCSTEEKTFQESQNPNRIMSGTLLFADKNSTFELSPRSASPKPLNLSSGTYVKGNISSETYTKGNTSGGTYVLEASSIGDITGLDISPVSTRMSRDMHQHQLKKTSSPILNTASQFSSTLNESSSGARLLNLSGDNCKNIVEANLWASDNKKKSLGSIKEESLSLYEPSPFRAPMKRKSISPYVEPSPSKRPNIEHIENWTMTKNHRPSQINRHCMNDSQKEASKVTKGINNSYVIVTHENKKELITDPYILAATLSVDPFMYFGLYYDPVWVEVQEKNFKKWLNALLTPPIELDTNTESHPMDVAKIWQQCKKTDVAEAPTRETISSQYHINNRLTSLRKSARNLFLSPEVAVVLLKVTSAVESQKLQVREDRNIHLDLGLQSEITSLLLSFNPLWLRIGLETIYNEVIHLNSNSDIMGLSSFLMHRFFKDPHLLKKFKSIHTPKYITAIKKFILKKFLVLVYFLDQAKSKKLIGHDPCLFCKNAPVKECREILIRFARDTLFAIGDITKSLRLLGYVVTHKQTYINEFDYAVKCLGRDLRDGVRLTRVMEIILLRDDLSNKLRVPAISRLQKIHNTKLVFDALEGAGYQILHDIDPKDIVDGYREKTLSFLWQIIYKFQAPLMVKHATIIQKWWRSLAITIKRRHLQKRHLKKQSAALKIQKWYRRIKISAKLDEMKRMVVMYLEHRRRLKAAIKIQSRFRMYLVKKKYLKMQDLVIKIQSYSRKWLVNNCYKQRISAAIKIQNYMRMYLARKNFLRMKCSVLSIEKYYIAYKNMKRDRTNYVALKQYALRIQRTFRGKKLMKITQQDYLELKAAALTIQSKFRANQAMKKQHQAYLLVKCSAIRIQKWYRATKQMQNVRTHFLNLKRSVSLIEDRYRFLHLKWAAVVLQRRFRANMKMKLQYLSYQLLIQAAIVVQRRYRAKKIRLQYKRLKLFAVAIQNQYRANKAMKSQRKAFLELKNAAICVQNLFRANQKMKICKKNYERKKESAVKIQRYYRSYKMMAAQRSNYKKLRKSVIIIQQHFRSRMLMLETRKNYISAKNAAIKIQTYYRSYRRTKRQCEEYKALRKNVLIIQRRYRANRLMLKTKREYQKLKESTVKIQRSYRARKEMMKQKKAYDLLRNIIMKLQQRWKANMLMKKQRKLYLEKRKTVILIQRKWRAKKSMQSCRNYLLLLKSATVVVQQKYRANISRRLAVAEYTKLKQNVLIIQRRVRANILMKKQRDDYLKMISAAVTIQRHFGAFLKGKQQRLRFVTIKKAVNVIETRYQAKKLMNIEYKNYQNLRNVTIIIQRHFRADQLMKIQRRNYLKTKQATITLQQRWRARKSMLDNRINFLMLQKATITIQQKYRAYLSMKKQREEYLSLKTNVLTIQKLFRANKLMKQQRDVYHKMRRSVIAIQRFFRAYILGRQQRINFLATKRAVKTIECRYKAKVQMKIERRRFQELRKATILCQQLFRARKMMLENRSYYKAMKKAVVTIEKRFIEYRIMCENRTYFLKLKRASVLLQQRYRARLLMKTERRNYLNLRRNVIMIQTKYRAIKLMQQQRSEYILARKAIIWVQNQCRNKKLTKKTQERYIEMKKSAIVIQRFYRSYKQYQFDHNYFLKLKRNVIFIQRRFRDLRKMKAARGDYLSKRSAAICIQKHFRKRLEAKYVLHKTVIQMKTVVKMQPQIRGFLVRRKLAPLMTEEKRKALRIRWIQIRAAVKIQSLWRAYRSRKTESKVFKEIRDRLKDANQLAIPEKTIGYRNKQAVRLLMTEDVTLSQILTALEEIERVTRISPDACHELGKILPDQMYLLLMITARSPPEMKACDLATNILINFSKYAPTLPYAWHPEMIEGILTVMLNWCDKESSLFPNLCTLLWLFAHKAEYKTHITSSPNYQMKMNKIEVLCVRKCNMVQRSRVKASTIFFTYKTLPLPTLHPEWSLYEKKSKTFNNAMHALRSLQKILE